MKTHIFLIGMMGCGKSTMGKSLARLLDCPMLDLDEAISAHAGKTIPEIFAEGGDPLFRRHETAALRRAIAAPPCVVATGGGIVTREENIALMREHGLVVWLCRPLEQIIRGIDASGRPLLAGDAEARMRALYARREPLYAAAAHVRFDNRMSKLESAKRLAEREEIRALL